LGTILFVKHNLSSTEDRAKHGLDIATTEILDARAKSGTDSVNYLYLPLRYGIAVVSVAVALGLRLLLDSLFMQDSFLLLVLGASMLSTAIIVSAWYGGLGPGILATALSALVTDYVFLQPKYSFSDPGVASTPLIGFVFEGILVSSLAAALRFARRRAKESAREARSQEERYRAVVEQAAEGILLADVDTKRVLDANTTYQGLLGYSPEEISRLTLYDLVPYSREDMDCYVGRVLERGRYVSGRRRHLRKDGSLVDVEVSANVISGGGREIVCMVVHDVTERKRAEEELHRLNQELAEREHQLHNLAGRMIAVQEEERRRVAYEVHDGFAQIAAAAYRRLQTFAEHRGPESAEAREELENAIALVQRTVGEARYVVANLRPITLDDSGLATAIRMQIEELQTEGFEASYECTLGEERLPPMLEINLFRVTQEALNNVRKHAETNRLRVSIGRHDGVVRLEVIDWGRGFHPSEVRTSGGPGERVGLSSMHDRVALLSGSLQIRSEPGGGTSVVAEVPLPVAREENEEADHEG
jgi:PAS domain S-box-containing protein